VELVKTPPPSSLHKPRLLTNLKVQSYTDPKYFAIIMSPVADYNLFEYYIQASTSSDKLSLLRSFFGCLAHGLRYLHDVKVRHRDIKPQNILVQADRVLLTDFGISLDWENLSRATTTADSRKTWPYAAPKVAFYQKRNNASDIWSLGCIFLEMVSVLKGETIEGMRTFFRGKNESYRIYENLNVVPEWLDKLKLRGEGKDDAPVEWVRQMLQEEQESRPTAAKIANDIVFACVEQHVLFCGPCCREDVYSSGMDDAFDEGEDELWKLEEGI
jgi:serine/threonine protein kinase